MTNPIRAGKRLDVLREEAPEGVVLRLRGDIDDSLLGDPLIEGLKGKHVVFDLDEVRRITSFGVRAWINALRTLEVPYYGFVNVRPPMVAQFNMVTGFGAGGEVISLYLPYRCDTCAQEFEHRIDLRTAYDQLSAAGTTHLPCPSCGGPAQFDDLPEAYLAHVLGSPRPSPPASVAQLLDPTAATRSPGLQLSKDVRGSVTHLRLKGELDVRASMKRVADGLEGLVLIDLTGVTKITPEGAAKLGALLRAHTETYLTGLTESCIEAFLPDVGALLAARVLDVRLPTRCPDHHVAPVVFDAARWSAQSAPCHLCGKPAALLLGSAMRAVTAKLKVVEKPEPVAELLGEGATLEAGNLAEVGAPSINQRLFGKYELLRRLGVGGMAEVFLARETGPGGFERKVALKRMLPALWTREDFVEMFLREARVAARLAHPNVVLTLDFGQLHGQYYIAMEFVRGCDLNHVLRSTRLLGQQIPVPIACRIIADASAGLHAAHAFVDEAGHPSAIIHRDISPHNVLLGLNGTVKIADFGIAKAADMMTQTVGGVVKGKLSYVAPERVSGSTRPLDPRSDLFSMGVVLYQLLTGFNPFVRENELATAKALLEHVAPPVACARPDVSAELEAVVGRALRRTPEERFQSAEELRLALEALHPASSAQVAGWLSELLSTTEGLAPLPPGVIGITPSGRANSTIILGEAIDPADDGATRGGTK